MSDRPDAAGAGAAGRPSAAETAGSPALASPADAAPGTVWLVGTGPGDPGLLTVRALEAIGAADVVLHDRLIPAAALAVARPDAELVDVGKRGGGRQVAQETTEELLVRRALEGRSVARVKGGDPFVFGRGGEEAQTLHARGIPFEVVPGVTAGIAAPAYAGIPVTHRGLAPAMALVTGHEDPSKPETQIDWEALARFPGTLCLYMAVKGLPRIAEALITAGRDPEEPAAVVQDGTVASQRVVAGTLRTLPGLAAEAGVRAPAITVVGPVAALHDEIAWFERRPLHGVRVAVTRARAQASGLAARLRGLGAEVAETPTIRTRSLEVELPDPAGFDLVAVTSPTGARELLAGLRRAGRDARALSGVALAAVGPGTGAALAELGLDADVVPEAFSGEGLAAALAERPVRRALLVRAAAADDALPAALRGRGAEVADVAAYETVAEPLDDAARTAIAGADYVTFTSASTARALAEAAGSLAAALGAAGPAPSPGGAAAAPVADAAGRSVGSHATSTPADRAATPSAGGTTDLGGSASARSGRGPRALSIGSRTSAALRELGREPDVEASSSDLDGLVAALLADVAARGTGTT